MTDNFKNKESISRLRKVYEQQLIERTQMRTQPLQPIQEFSNILIQENVEATSLPKLKTTRSILSNPSSISAGRSANLRSKSRDSEPKEPPMSIREESQKKRVQFEEMYDHKNIKDIKQERINRAMKLEGHIRNRSHSISVSPHHSRNTSKQIELPHFGSNPLSGNPLSGEGHTMSPQSILQSSGNKRFSHQPSQDF